MVVEILYGELCNLYGDIANIKYLKKCLPDLKIIETKLGDTPYFTKNKVNLIYMGPLTEKGQEKVIKALSPYTADIKKRIQDNTPFLITGNALEVFCNYIKDGEKIIDCLKIFDFYTERYMLHRKSTLVLGKYKNLDIVGYKAQFTLMFGDNKKNYFVKNSRGFGLNEDTNLEGIIVNNFFGTYLLGPLLIINPYFTKELLKIMGVNKPKLVFEKEMIDAYKVRLKEYKDENLLDDIRQNN